MFRRLRQSNSSEGHLISPAGQRLATPKFLSIIDVREGTKALAVFQMTVNLLLILLLLVVALHPHSMKLFEKSSKDMARPLLDDEDFARLEELYRSGGKMFKRETDPETRASADDDDMNEDDADEDWEKTGKIVSRERMNKDNGGKANTPRFRAVSLQYKNTLPSESQEIKRKRSEKVEKKATVDADDVERNEDDEDDWDKRHRHHHHHGHRNHSHHHHGHHNHSHHHHGHPNHSHHHHGHHNHSRKEVPDSEMEEMIHHGTDTLEDSTGDRDFDRRRHHHGHHHHHHHHHGHRNHSRKTIRERIREEEKDIGGDEEKWEDESDDKELDSRRHHGHHRHHRHHGDNRWGHRWCMATLMLLLSLVASSCLLVGAHQRRPAYLQPYIFMGALDIVLVCIAIGKVLGFVKHISHKRDYVDEDGFYWHMNVMMHKHYAHLIILISLLSAVMLFIKMTFLGMVCLCYCHFRAEVLRMRAAAVISSRKVVPINATVTIKAPLLMASGQSESKKPMAEEKDEKKALSDEDSAPLCLA